jgi:lysophospholipase L1-like esterase
MYQLQDTLHTLQITHHLHQILVIELGTNGPFDPTMVEHQLNALHEKEILIINTRVPRPWQNDVNALLEDVVKHVAHAHLLNWYALSSNHNAYFFPDGVHLNPLGARVLCAWILHDLMNF